MKSRLLGLLIIFIIIVLGFFYWVFIYVPNNSLIDDENQNILENDEINLVEVEIPNTEIIEEINNTENLNEESYENLSPQEKIEALKNNIGSYKIINVGENKFSFQKEDNNLVLRLNSKVVGKFDLVPQETINIQRIFSTTEEYFISIGNKNYIYNNYIESLSAIDIQIPIEYVKKSEDRYLIKTDKGIFAYDKINNSLEYQDIFEDFIYYNNGYIGIIKSSDDRRLNNLGITGEMMNSIIFYNPETKEKQKVYSTALDLTKIYEQDGSIYFEESGNKTYKLENY